MTSLEQFEEWAEEAGALPWGYLKKQRTQNGGYSVQIYNYMWSAWKASRETVEVVLPQAINTEEIGRAISKERTMTRLALAGIKVIKGEKRMAKSTDVHDLLTAYQKQARKIPAKGVYASRRRQIEVQAAHERKVMRKRRRSVGKSNKLGFRLTAEIRVALICDMNFWALVCRSNRQNGIKVKGE